MCELDAVLFAISEYRIKKLLHCVCILVFGVEIVVADKIEEIGSGMVVVDEALVNVCWESAGVVLGNFSFRNEFLFDAGCWVFAEFVEECFWFLGFSVDA